MAPVRTAAGIWITREGPLAWTFPAGIVLIATTVVSLAVFLLYPRATAPACEMELRTVLTFAIPIAAGGGLIGLSVEAVALVRLAVSALLVLALAVLTSLAVAALFPSFC